MTMKPKNEETGEKITARMVYEALWMSKTGCFYSVKDGFCQTTDLLVNNKSLHLKPFTQLRDEKLGNATISVVTENVKPNGHLKQTCTLDPLVKLVLMVQTVCDKFHQRQVWPPLFKTEEKVEASCHLLFQLLQKSITHQKRKNKPGPVKNPLFPRNYYWEAKLQVKVSLSKRDLRGLFRNQHVPIRHFARDHGHFCALYDSKGSAHQWFKESSDCTFSGFTTSCILNTTTSVLCVSI